ncbi:MAG: Lar family restriction alleviation protein [Ruminococcus sp.]|nr:Lar family restriction alleviation protein [Ruminococcus sp.]
MKAMAKALKPCPFCGCQSVGLHQEVNADGEYLMYIECNCCGARGSLSKFPYPQFADVKHTWNNRIALDVVKSTPEIQANMRSIEPNELLEKAMELLDSVKFIHREAIRNSCFAVCDKTSRLMHEIDKLHKEIEEVAP